MSLQKFKDALSTELFGMTIQQALEQGLCIDCKKKAIPRCHSEAGHKEYSISGLCEICFDAMFAVEE